MPDIIEVSNAGLIAADRQMLRHRLAQLTALYEKRCMMGGNEARGLLQLIEEIKTRLSPPNPQELNDRAEKIINSFAVCLQWAKDALAAVELAEAIACEHQREEDGRPGTSDLDHREGKRHQA